MKSKSGLWWVCMLWVAIVGQAYSYPAMSCQMMTNHDGQGSHLAQSKTETPAQVMDHSMMDHSQMHHEMDNSTPIHSASDDCCGQDCQCPASACTAYSFIASVMWAPAANLAEDKVLVVDFTLHHGPKNALFRPPISA